MQNGLILFAHGARDARWAAPFTAIAAQVQTLQPDLQVRLAFLELMEPSLPAAADELVLAGCQSIHVQPLFLGTGGHLRRDLPLLMADLSVRHPLVAWNLQTAIGELESVQSAMALASVRNLE
jgi:sirohydrochlorin cobaltochelatase